MILIFTRLFLLFRCPVLTTNQYPTRVSTKSMVPLLQGKMSSLQVRYHNITGEKDKPKETDLCQPLQRNYFPLSDKMKDLINFIDLRAKEKSLRKKNTEEYKVMVDLDETKVDVLGEMPKEAAFYSKKISEEGMVVDIPKSSLLRGKRWNHRGKFKNKHNPLEIRLIYKTSTPRFRKNQRQYRTTKIFKKVYKAIPNPFKNMGIETKKNILSPKYNKRSQASLKPVGILNFGGKNVPKICHASHYSNQFVNNPISYLKIGKKSPGRSLVVPLGKRGQEALNNSLQVLKKKTEISEAALFQIINKLIQDSTENKSTVNLDISVGTERPINNLTGCHQATHRINKSKGTTLPSNTSHPDFNLAVIIAKLTHEPEYPTITTTLKYRWHGRSSTAGSLATNHESITKPPLSEVETKLREKYHRTDTETMNSNDFKTDKCKMDKVHSSLVQPKQAGPKEGLNSLLKEIIKHVSIALDAVTTSKEFLEFLSCETGSGKSFATPVMETESTVCNPPITTRKEFHIVECSEADKKKWQKTRDDCMKMEVKSSTELQSNSNEETSTSEYSTKVVGEIPKNNISTNIECEDIQTSSVCTIFLDDEEEYFEGLNITGYSPLLDIPDEGNVIEDCQTNSYKVKKDNIKSSHKRNRKNNVEMATENESEVGAFEAKELMRGLRRYHAMLKDPVVTKIWRFFELSTAGGSCEFSTASPPKLKKRKSRTHEIMKEGDHFQQDNFKLKFQKRKKVNSNIQLNELGDLELAKLLKICDPGSTQVRDKYSGNALNQLRCNDKAPSNFNLKVKKVISESNAYSSNCRNSIPSPESGQAIGQGDDEEKDA